MTAAPDDDHDRNSDRSSFCMPLAGNHNSPGGRGSGVLGHLDKEILKQQVRDRILKDDQYDVKMFYYKAGFFQEIAKHHIFENITLGVISANAVWMGIDTDRNPAETILDAEPLFQIADSFFCVYFTIELWIRFMAFEVKRDCLKSGWFIFDSTLVALMLMETVVFTLITLAAGGSGGSPLGQSSILRLFRLLRLSRLTRILRSLPELMIMIRGMMSAMKSVSYVMMLLLIIVYVFGIAFTQLSSDYLHDTYFVNVSGAMYSLLVYATFLDNLADFTGDLKDEAPWLLGLASIFMMLACLTVMNMLIGVLCDIMTSVATTEKESIAVSMVKEKFEFILNESDQDGNHEISWEEFKMLLKKDEVLEALQQVGVDPVGMIDFAEDFFMEDGEHRQLSFEEFMGMVLDLRGSQTCKVKDIMDTRRRFEKKFRSIDTMLDKLMAQFGLDEEGNIPLNEPLRGTQFSNAIGEAQ